MTLAEDDPRHGSLNGYGHYRCRCELCRQAKEIHDRAYRAANRDKRLAYLARYNVENAERIKASMAAYRAANPEKVRAAINRWYAANSVRVRAANAEYQAEHLEQKHIYQAKYQANHPEVRRANQQTRRARKRGQWVEYVDHVVVWQRDRGICHICDEPADLAKWHLDHIIPLALGGEHSYANTAVSHPGCNGRKGARI